jgi:hypothetical protein
METEKNSLLWSQADFETKYLSTSHLSTIRNGLQFISDDLEFNCDFNVHEKDGRIYITAMKR